MKADPYAPPPRHRERSGAIVRYAIIGVLLAGGAWAYMNYADQDNPGLVASEEEMLADSSLDAPTTAPVVPAPEAEPAPAANPAPAKQRSAPAAEPPPPPSTSIGAPPAG